MDGNRKIMLSTTDMLEVDSDDDEVISDSLSHGRVFSFVAGYACAASYLA